MSKQEKSNGDTKYKVPALEKGLDILEALATTPAPQSLADLGRTLNRSSSELFRMLNCLESRNYVVRDEASGNYQLSLKLYTLAHTHSTMDHLLSIAIEPMQTLANTVRESCHLSMLSHGKLVVLAQVESPRRVQLSIGVGREFSAIHTVSGRLLLAFLPPKKLTCFLANDPDYQQLDATKKEAILESLQAIQKKGYASTQDETHIGIRDTAVLVGNPDIGLTAALAIPSLQAVNRPADEANLLKSLQDCAEKITQAIGVK